MNRLFTNIRWRLVGWTMLILAVILLALGTTIYVAVARSLNDEVDRSLLSSSEQALPVLAPPPGGRGRPDDREGYRGGVFYIGSRGDGDVLNPQQVDISSLSWAQPDFRQLNISTTTRGVLPVAKLFCTSSWAVALPKLPTRVKQPAAMAAGSAFPT